MIWVLGARGLLGSELLPALDRAGLKVFGTGREVDIGDPRALADFSRGKAFSWIVNCAAYTAVDKAESDSAACFRVNAEGPANLGRLAESLGAACLHISSDYVFDGRAREAYREEDEPNPLSVYGKSKAEGERALRKACPRHVILRTAWLYGSKGQDFVSSVLEVLRSGAEAKAVADQVGSPTWSRDLALAIAAIVSGPSGLQGTWHYAGSGAASRYEFAWAIRDEASRLGLLSGSCHVLPAGSAAMGRPAPRPAFSALSTEKIGRIPGIRLRPWREGLAEFLALKRVNA